MPEKRHRIHPVRSRALIRAASVVWIATAATSGAAHEFWLEPDVYQPKLNQEVPITVYVGQFFKGAAYPYLSYTFFHFKQRQGADSSRIRGLEGDDPAATLEFGKPGLAIITQHTRPEALTFETFDKFSSYLSKEGLEHIVARHRLAGKSEAKIKERYARAAKLLLDVGARGGGVDQYTGMPLELVADRNPYCLKTGESLPVQLLYRGNPLQDIQISVFAKPLPKEPLTYRTDKQGHAQIALPTNGPWLLSAVYMLEPEADMNADWFSLWASLVFARPASGKPGPGCAM